MKDISRWVVFVGIFAVPFIPLIIANSLFFPFITGKNFTFRIIVEIIFASWIILALYEPIYRPKFSWILAGLGSLIVVMFFANLLGEYPEKSFWSNFERMEGYVTLVHVFMYFLVVGSVLNTEKLWNYFFNTTIAAAVILSLYAFAQLSGEITINQGGWRLDGTLGNSAYMAIYMLFHTFIAALMFARTSSNGMRYVYGGLTLLFIFLLIQTATRGTILGLIGGGILAMTYISLFATRYPMVRKAAAGGLLGMILIVGAFIALKDSSLVQNQNHLRRIANISLDEATTRFSIWTMAFEGVKERPVLGWGQGNYNYVFNKYYKPTLYDQEPWFDRVHNIVLDWLIAGGVLGAAAYFSIILAALYYLLVQPLMRKDEEEAIPLVVRGLLFGLLAAYVFHNVFVFDNIVSYIFFASILAYIHSRHATAIPSVMAVRTDARVVEQVATPIAGVVLLATIYFVNVPAILAAGDIIDAFRAPDATSSMAAFERALARDSFGNQEIREQMTRQTLNFIRSQEVSPDEKQRVFKLTEGELMRQNEEKPNDARVNVFIASYYRGTGNWEEAQKYLDAARALSPQKQQIIFEQGYTALQTDDYERALQFFKEAYELEPVYLEARILYASAAYYAGKPEIADEILSEERYELAFARNDLAVQAVYAAKDYEQLQKMFAIRTAENPDNVQFRVNHAVSYYEAGDVPRAVEILEQAIEDIPSFKEQGEGFIEDLRAGRAPGQQAAPDVTVSGQPVTVQQ